MAQMTNGSHYRFTFKRRLNIDDVADSLTLAVCAAEGLHGRARVRLDGSWRLDRQRRTCVIDASTPIGLSIAQLLTSFLAQEFGEGAFTVRRPAAEPTVQRPK